MKFAEKTIKLEKLIEAKVDLEMLIKMNILKKQNLLFTKEYDVDIIKSIDETIATIDEQLIEVKLVIQLANTNEVHEDGNSNNYYIYKLSSLNRKLANLRDLEEKGDFNLTAFEKEPARGSHYPHNKNIRERLSTKKEIEKRMKDVAKEIVETTDAIAELKPKLSEFNKRINVKVKVLEGFEEFKSLK